MGQTFSWEFLFGLPLNHTKTMILPDLPHAKCCLGSLVFEFIFLNRFDMTGKESIIDKNALAFILGIFLIPSR